MGKRNAVFLTLSTFLGVVGRESRFVVNHRYDSLENTGHEAIINGKKAGEMTVHILISSYLYGLFEPIAHEMKKDEAIEYVNELKYFFDVGWADILKLK